MPANFVSGFFGNNQAFWHGCGVVIPEDVVTAERVCELVPELKQTVKSCRLWVQTGDDEGFPVVDHFANVREDGTLVGIVGTDYRIVQTHEAFSFLDDLFRDNRAKIHTAGVLDGGRKVWMQARRPEGFRVAGIPEEEHDCFVTWMNSYDGSTKVLMTSGTRRVGCENTYFAAIAEATNRYEFSHTKSAASQVAVARHALGIAEHYWEAVERLSNAAIRQEFSDKEFSKVVDAVIPLPSLTKLDFDPEQHKRREANAEKERDALKVIWLDSPTLQNVRGTAYAAINAVTEYFDHHTVTKDSRVNSWQANRFKRLVLDPATKENATKVIRELAGIGSLS
jgi:phage/plasmid-like protein (TIGR03299 family)